MGLTANDKALEIPEIRNGNH